MERLLEIRKKQKNRKPQFDRQDAHKKVRLSSGWRKPKGSDSKMRVGLRGYRKSVEVGYKSPAEVRGLSRDGLVQVNVARKEDLAAIDPKTQGIIISSKTGMKKRMEILAEAISKKIRTINIKDAQKYLDGLNERFQKRKDLKAKTQKVKEEKQKAAEEKKAPKAEEKSSSGSSDEEKKKSEKKEKDKILTKKD